VGEFSLVSNQKHIHEKPADHQDPDRDLEPHPRQGSHHRADAGNRRMVTALLREGDFTYKRPDQRPEQQAKRQEKHPHNAPHHRADRPPARPAEPFCASRPAQHFECLGNGHQRDEDRKRPPVQPGIRPKHQAIGDHADENDQMPRQNRQHTAHRASQQQADRDEPRRPGPDIAPDRARLNRFQHAMGLTRNPYTLQPMTTLQSGLPHFGIIRIRTKRQFDLSGPDGLQEDPEGRVCRRVSFWHGSI
jgi:hypothetical protein